MKFRRNDDFKGGLCLNKKITLKQHNQNFLKYRYLLKELVSKNIKLQYRDSALGLLWTFLQPLLTMILLSIVFNNLFGRDSSKVVNYPVYLLSGRLLHEFFTLSTKRAMRSIRAKANVIKKVYVPKYIYPLSQVLSTYVTFLISLIVLVVVIAFFNIVKIHPITITWNVFYCIIPLITLFFFSLGVGMFLAALNVFFKDIENIYDVLCLLLFYVTPIVYSIDKLGFKEGSWQLTLIKLNPMYGIISNFRTAVLWGTDFAKMWDVKLMIYGMCAAFAAMVVGFIVFYKTQDKFILHI